MKKFFLFLFSLAVAASANSSGLKVNPSKLEIKVKPGQSLSRVLTVGNPTSDVQIFKIYPDEFADIIRINPSSFTLEAGAEKTVAVTVETKHDEIYAANLSTNLSVVANPLAKTQFATNAGIKVPLEISIVEDQQQKMSKEVYGILVAVVAVASGAATHFLRRKTKSDS